MADSNFYDRISQIGEYTNNNRLNLVFVYQLTFIVILSFIVLYYFNSIQLLSTPNLWIISLLLIFVMVIIYLNRLVVLPKLKDPNDYNKYNFGDNTLNPTQPHITNSGTTGGNQGPPPAVITCTSFPAPPAPPAPTPVCTTVPSPY